MESAKERVLHLMEKIAEEQNYKNYKVDVKDINSEGANLTSALFLATLSAKEKDELHLFAKVAMMSDNIRKVSPTPCPFKTELYFYSEVIKQYERLQEKHNMPEEHRLKFPKIYGSHDEYLNETIVLENLVAQGFKTHDRLKTIDFEYACAAIGLIAKFHALSLAYYKDEPEEFEAVLKKLIFDPSGSEAIIEMMKPKMLATAYGVATDENREKLEKFLEVEDGRDRFMEFLSMLHSSRARMLVHGDFKASNLMHRRRNEILEMTPVDFQLVHNGSPITDVMYFLFTAADEEFRRQHYHQLMEQYYVQLRLALERLHVDPEDAYPEKMFRMELEEKVMLGLMVGMILLPMIVVAEENLPTFGEGSEISDFIVTPSDLYKERFNGIINNYKEWGLL